jgi:hypothetical protein
MRLTIKNRSEYDDVVLKHIVRTAKNHAGAIKGLKGKKAIRVEIVPTKRRFGSTVSVRYSPPRGKPHILLRLETGYSGGPHEHALRVGALALFGFMCFRDRGWPEWTDEQRRCAPSVAAKWSELDDVDLLHPTDPKPILNVDALDEAESLFDVTAS